jgi:hypothetical protein
VKLFEPPGVFMVTNTVLESSHSSYSTDCESSGGEASEKPTAVND